MTAERDVTRVVRSWLEEGATALPDRVLDVVLDQVPATRQRRRPWPTWTRRASSGLRIAVTATVIVAVLMVALAVAYVGPWQSGVGGGPTPVPTPTATPRPVPMGTGAIDPGRYRLSNAVAIDGIPISITVPTGWTAYEGFAVDKNYGAQAGASLVSWRISNTYVDPCTDHTFHDPAPGSGIGELIAALANQPGIQASPPSNVTVDGFDGKVIELTVTTDITTCGVNAFWLWGDSYGSKYAQDTNEMDRVYVLDVDGVRLTFFARFPPRITPADREELEAVIRSIDIEH